MHECAEHGLAAHWLYKEAENKMPVKESVVDSGDNYILVLVNRNTRSRFS